MNRVFSDAGAPTYVYEFQHRSSFSSVLKPKTLIADHGDEIFFVFGVPLLKGDGPLVTTSLDLGDLGSRLGLVALGKSSFSTALSFPNLPQQV